MSDSSAGHCAKHRRYRCSHCETLYEDSYHDDWDEVVRDQEKRIEQMAAQATADMIMLSDYVARIEELEAELAELAKLREAADRVAFEAEADDWSCMPSIQACKKLAAALEGE